MKRNGFTLIELLITSAIIAPIIALAICSLFMVEYNFRGSVEDLTSASREVRVGMQHMVRVLRFCDPASVSVSNNQIDATVMSGHLSYIPSDTAVRFYVDAGTKTLKFTQFGSGGTTTEDVAKYVEHLTASWANPELSLELKAVAGRHQIVIKTMVRVLGDL